MVVLKHGTYRNVLLLSDDCCWIFTGLKSSQLFVQLQVFFEVEFGTGAEKMQGEQNARFVLCVSVRLASRWVVVLLQGEL